MGRIPHGRFAGLDRSQMIYRIFICCIFCIVCVHSSLSFALTYPATPTVSTYTLASTGIPVVVTYYNWNFASLENGPYDVSHATADEAVVKLNAAYSPGVYGTGEGQNCVNKVLDNKITWASRVNGVCPTSNLSSRTGIPYYECPTGRTYANYMCNLDACASGDTLVNGACEHTTYTCNGSDVLSGQTCTSAASCAHGVTVKGPQWWDVGTSANEAAMPSNPCISGCNATWTTAGGNWYTALVNGVKHWFINGSYVSGNISCSPDTNVSDYPSSPGATPPSSTCPPGKNLGTINGISACYDTSPTTTPTTPTTTTTKTTTSLPSVTSTDSDSSQTTTTTVINYDGTQTVTTVIVGPSGHTTTTKETTVIDPDANQAFCQQHPGDPLCSADKTPCEIDPNSVGCMNSGTPVDDQVITHETRAISQITAAAMPTFAATADTRLVSLLSGPSIEFSYKPLNDFAAMIRPFILALAWLSAALIFIRGFND